MKMKLGTKITLSFSVILVITAFVAFLSYLKLGEIANSSNALISKEVPVIKNVQEVKFNISQQSSNIRGYFFYNNEKYLDNFRQAADANLNLINSLEASEDSATNKQMVSELKEISIQYRDVLLQQAVPLYKQGKINDLKKILDTTGVPLVVKMYEVSDKYLKATNVHMDSESTRLTEESDKVKNTVMIISIIAIILGIGISIFVTRLITKPILKLSEVARIIASGDLTKEVDIHTKDEIEELANSFNTMVNSLRTVIRRVSEASQALAASSEELSASAEETTAATEQVANTIGELSGGATKQSEEVESTSTVVNQMSASIQQVAANTNLVSLASIKVSEIANLGSKESINAVNKIERVKEVSNKTADVVKSLGQESERIGQIVDVIKGIADQTNLLALNAAIEAARAGEQGRGFAVVAEEVRKLAEQSSTSAEQIAGLIGNIQSETSRAVSVIDVGTKEVEEGVQAVIAAGESFKTIVTEVDKVVGQIQEVSAATQQMASGSNNVVLSINSIATIAEQTAASSQEVSASAQEQTAAMEEVSRSAQELASLAEKLQSTINNFKY
jgi:methyl-accepting chemotaxis protein